MDIGLLLLLICGCAAAAMSNGIPLLTLLQLHGHKSEATTNHHPSKDHGQWKWIVNNIKSNLFPSPS
jgi:hypothetical protein